MLTVLKITAARGAMMTASELSAWLGRTLIFDGLDPEDIDRLAAIVRESSLQQGDILFEQGDESDGLYLIVAGLVRVYLTTEDGREVTVSLLEDGEVIGEMSLLDGLPRSAGAAALIETRLIFIPRAPFLELLETNGKLARQIIRVMMMSERPGFAARASDLFRARIRSPSWRTSLDVYPCLIAASIPWSTTAVIVFLLIWLIVLLPTIEPVQFGRVARHPAALAPIALVALAVVGILWAEGPWLNRWQGIGPAAKLL
ncbi:MAG: cyclic nucleotide-binding domain-containing protein, partial [Rhizobiales bacterium]|nr:cyclic nucleotide-binding domain-containing protein [Hyphomicrobiales bacterium]